MMNNGNSTNTKANSMIQNEFIAIKHLVGRHQMSIVKIESALKQINEWKNEFNVAKIYEDHKSDLEILKKYIEEVNDYNTNLYKNTESQLHTKADFNFFEEFKQNVEDRVMKDLKTKIDKIDHKRVQNTIKKKFEAIEKEINEIEKNTLSGSHPFKSPFLKTNDKCISCNKKIDDGDEYKTEESIKIRAKNKYLFKELYQNAQKLGGGFSRILETLDDPNDLNLLTATDSISKEDDSTFIMNLGDISQSIPHVSSIIKSNKKRSSSILKDPQGSILPKFNVSESVTILPSIKTSTNSILQRELENSIRKKARKEISTQRIKNSLIFPKD